MKNKIIKLAALAFSTFALASCTPDGGLDLSWMNGEEQKQKEKVYYYLNEDINSESLNSTFNFIEAGKYGYDSIADIDMSTLSIKHEYYPSSGKVWYDVHFYLKNNDTSSKTYDFSNLVLFDDEGNEYKYKHFHNGLEFETKKINAGAKNHMHFYYEVNEEKALSSHFAIKVFEDSENIYYVRLYNRN